MGNIIDITKDKNSELNKKTLNDLIKTLDDKEIKSFVFAVETKDNRATFACAMDSNLITLVQGYLNHFYADTAYAHMDSEGET